MTHRTMDPPLLPGTTDELLDLPACPGSPALRMHLVEAGQGPPLLLLHGAPQCHLLWSELLPRYAEHFRVLCPDLRGAGWTEAPGRGYTPSSLIEDLRALLDAQGIERVRIVAHDWSAIIALLLAMQEPRRVERLVILSVPDLFVRPDVRALRLMASGWFQLALCLPLIGPLAVRGGRQRLLRHMQSLTGSAATGPLPFARVDRELLRDPARARDLCRLYRTTVMPTLLGLFVGRYRRLRLEVPTLQLVGAEDPVALLLRMGRFPGRTTELHTETIPGAGHFLVDEAGAEVLARSLDFLLTAHPDSSSPSKARS